MKRSTSGLLLSRAIDGFVLHKVVEGLSDTTITSYTDHLKRFLSHSGDILLPEIDPCTEHDRRSRYLTRVQLKSCTPHEHPFDNLVSSPIRFCAIGVNTNYFSENYQRKPTKDMGFLSWTNKY